MSDSPRRPAVNRWVFWPSAAVVVAFSTFAIVAPSFAESMLGAVQSFVVNSFSWYYVLIAAFFVVISLWFGFSRFGDIKLGRDNDKPEFSLMSWFALLFAAGMGIGLVFYGVSEPLNHFVDPKPGVTNVGRSALAQQALSQTYLHWGVHAWSIYVIVGLGLAYAIHRRRRPVSIRWTLEPLLGKRVKGAWGNTIDVIALIGTVFGVATSLGLGVMQISSGLSVAGIGSPDTFTQVIIILVITAFVLFSVLSGVGKGMKWLSNTNLVLAGLLLLFLLVAGPTVFLLREFVQSTGAYIQNFIALSFSTSAFSGADGEVWQSQWTSFYWGWWISWAPFVGIFIARISRGRTVREFVLGVIIVPTLTSILWFSVLGGQAIWMQFSGTHDFRDVNGAIDLQGALFEMLANVPGSMIVTIGVIILIAIFFITSADSGSLVMAMIATGGEAEPRPWARIFFTLITSGLAIALLLGGGLTALQTAAITIALPFSIVMLLIVWSTVIAFRREHATYEKARREQFIESIGQHYGLDVEEPLERGILPPKWFSRLRK